MLLSSGTGVEKKHGRAAGGGDARWSTMPQEISAREALTEVSNKDSAHCFSIRKKSAVVHLHKAHSLSGHNDGICT